VIRLFLDGHGVLWERGGRDDEAQAEEREQAAVSGLPARLWLRT
jgi:hypothetical protein